MMQNALQFFFCRSNFISGYREITATVVLYRMGVFEL